MRSRKYKNYGPVPRNEYSNPITENDANHSLPSEYAPLADGKEVAELLKKRRVHFRFGTSTSRGWLRSRSTNGWRAESASQQDEAADEKQIEHVQND